MKVLVSVKQVVDAYASIRVKPDESAVATEGLKRAINPFDEIAIEAAVQLKEQQLADEVIVLSIGPQAVQESLRKALALGADRALHIQTEREFDSLTIAKLFKAVVEREGIDLVIMGKQAIDSDNNQSGQMLAALLNWGQACFASSLTLSGQQATVTREIDGGLETLQLQLPAVITTDLRLNTPRFASLPNIMKAKKKPLETIRLEDLQITLSSHMEILKVSPPATRQAGLKLESVDDLVTKLRDEAKVLP